MREPECARKVTHFWKHEKDVNEGEDKTSKEDQENTVFLLAYPL